MSDLLKDIEIEIKLRLGSYPEYLKLIGHLGHMDREERLINCFYDTPERELSKAGWAYRVRAAGATGLVTLKGLKTVAGAAAIRREIQEEISRPLALEIIKGRHQPLDIDCYPVDYVKNELQFSGLEKITQFEILRQLKSYPIGDRQYTFEVDRTTFADGSSDYELEVELSDQDAIETAERDLSRLFEHLNIPFQVQVESKYARALANQTHIGQTHLGQTRLGE